MACVEVTLITVATAAGDSHLKGASAPFFGNVSLVYCVGPPDCNPRCWHWAAVPLDRLPDWDWYDICAHLKCMKCGSVGWVDPRPNWSEIIDFNKGIG